nr:immunoglobulin light chain junction region [Macaca mulatta]MOW27437.1 immunoglobulin light chain junction region [Macaca mulatta]MOW27494.1 immunoglobulin light chain junction region [Macaca mulatta]MOW27860.1 immunoglobulin light chain junction region [Macaca mulatta]MOW27888.1 immunoglobulin light chain junction region [Macaca mulatta]
DYYCCSYVGRYLF